MVVSDLMFLVSSVDGPYVFERHDEQTKRRIIAERGDLATWRARPIFFGETRDEHSLG